MLKLPVVKELLNYGETKYYVVYQLNWNKYENKLCKIRLVITWIKIRITKEENEKNFKVSSYGGVSWMKSNVSEEEQPILH